MIICKLQVPHEIDRLGAVNSLCVYSGTEMVGVLTEPEITLHFPDKTRMNMFLDTLERLNVVYNMFEWIEQKEEINDQPKS